MSVKACIFDFDGTLADSMWVWEAMGEEFTSRRGLEPFDGLVGLLAVNGLSKGAALLLRRYGLEEDPDVVLDGWMRLAQMKYATEVRFKEGAIEYLAQLKTAGIKTAIATAGKRASLMVALNNNDALGLLDVVLTADEVCDTGKATPAVYLAVSERLGVDPAECVVFEDVAAAAHQAHAGGMRVVGVRDDHAQQDRVSLTREADVFIEGFGDLLKKEIDCLF